MRVRIIFALAALGAGLGCAAELGDAKLVDAIKAGDRAAAIALIDQKANVNAAQGDGSTALQWAAHNNDTDLVERLLKAGADAKAKNDFGAAAISEAASHGNAQMLTDLLNAGADPDSPAATGETTLMLVARTNCGACAKTLLEHGAHANAKESQKQQTALMWAAAESQPAVMRELLARGADPNAQSFADDLQIQVSSEPRAGYHAAGGLTPLLYASREGCLECMKQLLDAGAKINLADPEGVTPLIMTIWNAHFDAAAMLIRAGAMVNKWDWWGRTPLYLAVDYNTLPHGGRSDAPSVDETTPLQIMSMLLEAGANPDIQLKLLPPYRNVGADRGVDSMLTIGASPLLRAAKGLDAPAIELLLKHGANPNLPNNQGLTPTMAAAGLGSVDADTRGWFQTDDVQERSLAAVKAMLAGGGHINEAGGRSKQTPLHGAAFWGWNKVVEYLVAQGADINAKDANGRTPVDSAMGRAGGNSRGGQRIDVHRDTAELLVKLGAATPVDVVKK